MAARRNSKLDDPIYESIYDSIDDLIVKTNGKNADEIKALESTIEKLRSKHKLEIAEKEKEIEAKELQIQAKENQIQLKDIQIQKLENESTPLKHEKQMETNAAAISEEKYDKMSTGDLLTKGIKQFFFEKNQTGLSNSYQEWFDVMRTRLRKNTPHMFKKCLVVKVTCKNPNQTLFKFFSYYENIFNYNETRLNIFNEAWTHDSTTVLILHPNDENEFVTMKESSKGNDYHYWEVDYVHNDYIDEDGYFIVLCLKKKWYKKYIPSIVF